MSDEFVFTNNAESSLAAPIGGGSTSFTVATGEGALFPSIAGGGGEKFEILVQEGSTSEYMTCTSRTGDILSVTRTDSNSFDAGATVKLVLTSTALAAMLQKGVHRTVTANPDGTLAADYTGEEVYDSINETWYKHLTGTVWAEINLIH
jgi:hypothetical protein